ncbi:prepilin-type N-terminal cleavage/methylation domain-containing protein [Vibrio sp. S4M6]|uniref:prepilin-type N-terminal cleavage/methylation domain-containing protein n=1 Tax=Vibrio sinus TaxID=2946865 RepID=UPI00202A1260|nr:prepilin-type N-terminal cleavage/methylation domain-containing protein [Vibrio sinus]MCL9780533.1 prepilin-type N-terminal cleavage/methylation domain-containing protein [Vibrio sinus]
MIYKSGFTLIESIIVMVIIAIAMISLTTLLFPQISRSADPNYQVRASALGQSLMSQILARGFDQESDFDGDVIRCSSTDVGAPNCSGSTGSSLTLGSDTGEVAPNYNDVDDYIGCWEPGGAGSCNDLDLIVQSSSSTYKNFNVVITVAYDNTNFTDWSMKLITLTITASNQTPITFRAFRGNY